MLCNSYLKPSNKIKFLEMLEVLDKRIIKKKGYFNCRAPIKKNYISSGIKVKKFEQGMLKWD
tara:strand:+ start:2754 stop:2939 length:186 start_codon:yes stop_codon:yes gene_type:complete